MSDSAPSGWETAVSEMESQVYSVLHQAQGVGTVLHSALQVREIIKKNLMCNDTFIVFVKVKLTYRVDG